MDRKDFFSTAFRLVAGKGLQILTENPIVTALEALAVETEPKQRPPGAAPEKEFRQLCTGCDACMIACPVDVIMIEDLKTRLPIIYPEKDPCIHCEGYPCIQSCPTGALHLSHGHDLRST